MIRSGPVVVEGGLVVWSGDQGEGQDGEIHKRYDVSLTV